MSTDVWRWPLVLALGVLLAIGPSGCWWLGRFFAPPAPATRLSAWHVTRIAVVPFADATNHQAGGRVAGVFARALAQALGAENIRLTAGPDVGLIGMGQAQRLGIATRSDALLAGQVLAFGWQPRLSRAWVSVSLRLLEAGRGSIIWSRNATGVCPVTDETALNAGLDEATELAAKEFIHDMLASPSQDTAGAGAGAGHTSSARRARRGAAARGDRG